MTHEDFVTYEQAVKLKELGFNWEYGKGFQMKTYYNFLKILGQFDEEIITTEIPAPTLAQTQKWLREKHNIDICIVRSFAFNKSYYYEVLIDGDFDNMIQQDSMQNFTYEQALSAGIDKALELLKTDNNNGD